MNTPGSYTRPTTPAAYWLEQARAARTGLPCACNAGSTVAVRAYPGSSSQCLVCNRCHAVGPNYQRDVPGVYSSRDTHEVLVEAECLAMADAAMRRAA